MYVRARHEAEEADKVYRSAVRRLDRQRLALEERLENTLKTLQVWELERLRAVKTGTHMRTMKSRCLIVFSFHFIFQYYFSTKGQYRIFLNLLNLQTRGQKHSSLHSSPSPT